MMKVKLCIKEVGVRPTESGKQLATKAARRSLPNVCLLGKLGIWKDHFDEELFEIFDNNGSFQVLKITESQPLPIDFDGIITDDLLDAGWTLIVDSVTNFILSVVFVSSGCQWKKVRKQIKTNNQLHFYDDEDSDVLFYHRLTKDTYSINVLLDENNCTLLFDAILQIVKIDSVEDVVENLNQRDERLQHVIKENEQLQKELFNLKEHLNEAVKENQRLKEELANPRIDVSLIRQLLEQKPTEQSSSKKQKIVERRVGRKQCQWETNVGDKFRQGKSWIPPCPRHDVFRSYCEKHAELQKNRNSMKCKDKKC